MLAKHLPASTVGKCHQMAKRTVLSTNETAFGFAAEKKSKKERKKPYLNPKD